MKVFSAIFEKIIWFIIFLFLLMLGGVFVLRVFLAPPPVEAPSSKNPKRDVPQSTPITPTQNPTPEIKATNPTPTQKPTPTVTPTIEAKVSISPANDGSNNGDSSINRNNSETPSPETSTSPSPDTLNNTSNEADNPDTMPALALPSQVAITIPRRLTIGAVLSIYENIDGGFRPDPVNYTPISQKKVSGLTLLDLRKPKFQEVSGYFLVKKTGVYNFLVSYPENSFMGYDNLLLRIDGQPLSRINGGSVSLEKGWHKVDLFYMESLGNNGNRVEVKWGREGSALKRLQVWRES